MRLGAGSSARLGSTLAQLAVLLRQHDPLRRELAFARTNGLLPLLERERSGFDIAHGVCSYI